MNTNAAHYEGRALVVRLEVFENRAMGGMKERARMSCVCRSWGCSTWRILAYSHNIP